LNHKGLGVESTKAEAWLAQWDAMGWHRAGTDGDRRSLKWLIQQVAYAGWTPVPQALDFTARRDAEASLTARGRRLEGISVFDAPDCPTAITASLAHGADHGGIGLVNIRPDAATLDDEPLSRLRRSAQTVALVALTESGDDALAPVNAPSYASPYGPPMLQLAATHRPELEAWCSARESVQLRIELHWHEARTFNLLAVAPDTPPFDDTLLVVAPRTSWYESTAERGGGLVAWLHLAHASGRAGLKLPPLALLATAGHEIGHLGIRAWLERHRGRSGRPRRALHLGANLGAAHPRRLTIRATRSAQAAALARQLIEAGYGGEVFVAPIDSCVGEARDLLAAEYDVVTLVGENVLFHAPGDRWPQAVHLNDVIAVARAVEKWLEMSESS
jgi:hypothetical protein